jgi:endonuclease/exonuclease/phosphatase (EEP) superfamily protein YafD
MRRALRLFFATALLAAGLALCGGFAGALHPAGDSLAVFRLPLAAAVLVAAFGLGLAGGPRRLAAFAALLATVAAAPAALSYLPRPVAGEGAAYTLYQKNVLSRLADPAPLVDDILASGAGIVTLQEVQQQNQPVLEALRPAYPTQAWCPYGGAGGTAVLSRWPALGEPLCAAGGGFTALRLDAPFGPVWAVSLHLYWPWPFDQARQATRLEPLLAGLEQPVSLGRHDPTPRRGDGHHKRGAHNGHLRPWRRSRAARDRPRAPAHRLAGYAGPAPRARLRSPGPSGALRAGAVRPQAVPISAASKG